MTHQPYYVSRQSNYYDQGAYSVEIARTFEHASPGMLVDLPAYSKFTGEYADPREAAKAALELAQVWWALRDPEDESFMSEDKRVPITLAMNHMVYPTVEDDETDTIMDWAEKQWEALPKCDRCGEIGAETWHDDSGEEVMACGEFCADELLTEVIEEDE